MILFVLGMIDLATGVLLLLSIGHIQLGFTITMIHAIFMFGKGLYSLAWKSYFASFTDMASGGILIFLSQTIFLHYSLVAIVGALMIIKSLQSMIFGIIR
ncbi:MAG: hypothetical protein HY512_01445 [Candidatus Aenigmarchaeota archaeon]|nr:hypothetical protein [Candidatus Aenigmarchaeota archaeon]